MSPARSLFRDIPRELKDELTEDLLARDDVRIERIVSRGHCSPPDFWYEQDENEWVVLLSGAARLVFEGGKEGGEAVELLPGDFLEIPAGVRHRVDWTDPDEDSVWLAVFFS